MANGLFNLTPSMVQDARRQQDFARAQQQFGGAGLFAPLATQGAMFQGSLNRSLGGDPQLQQAQDFQRIKQEASSLATPGSIEYHTIVRDSLQQAGHPQVAEQAQQKINELQAQSQGQLLKQQQLGLGVRRQQLAEQKEAREAQAVKDRKTQIINANGRVKLIDKQTGEEISDLGKSEDRSTKVLVNTGDSNTLKALNNAQKLKDNVMGPMLENREKMSGLKTVFREVAGGNPQALPSLRKAINSIYDTGNIGQREAEIALGESGLVGNFRGMIENLLSGNITQEKVINIGRFIEAMEKDLASSFNRRSNQFDKSLDSATEITPEIRNVLKAGKYKGKAGQGNTTSSGTKYRIIEE